MGCDIHTFIEYSDFTDQNGDPYWQSFGGQISLGRNYTMFGVIAGVCDDTYQLFEPRGLPDGKCSYDVDNYMRVHICDEGEEPGEGECTLKQAQSWGEPIEEFKGKPRWVRNPDLHSHSWLTLDELKHALAHYMLGDKVDKIGDVATEDRHVVLQAAAALQGAKRDYDVVWDAIVAAMEAFEANGCQTRLVFCFDN